MPDKKRSEYTYVTAVTADMDIVLTDDTRAVGDRNLSIIPANFFGASTEIPFNIALKRIGINPTFSAERDTGATAFVSAAGTTAQFGSLSTHPVRIFVDSIYEFEVATTGILSSAATYAHDMNGETIRPMQVNNSGEFGYDSSSFRVKTEIVNMTESKGAGIYSLRPVTYKPKDNPLKLRMGLIAEEVAPIFPEAVFHHVYKIVDGELVKPIHSNYDEVSWKDIQKKAKKDKEIVIKVKKVKSVDRKGKITYEDVEEAFIKMIEGINYTELISPMIKADQNQKTESDTLKIKANDQEAIINDLKARVLALEGG